MILADRPSFPLPRACDDTSARTQHRPRAALCLAGHARSFVRPHVHASIASALVGGMDAEVDVFVVFRDGDAPQKLQRGWSFSTVIANATTVTQAVATLNPRFVWRARTEGAEWLHPPTGCTLPADSFFATFTSRILGQVGLWAECHHEIERAEREDGHP